MAVRRAQWRVALPSARVGLRPAKVSKICGMATGFWHINTQGVGIKELSWFCGGVRNCSGFLQQHIFCAYCLLAATGRKAGDGFPPRRPSALCGGRSTWRLCLLPSWQCSICRGARLPAPPRLCAALLFAVGCACGGAFGRLTCSAVWPCASASRWLGREYPAPARQTRRWPKARQRAALRGVAGR